MRNGKEKAARRKASEMPLRIIHNHEVESSSLSRATRAIRRAADGPLPSKGLLLALTLAACQRPAFTPADDAAIRALMQQQAEAWSAGDLDGFMAPYADTICFHSPQGLTCGKQQVHDNYRRSYPDRAAMGRLRLDVHELIPAGANHAWLTGAWALHRQADSLSGAFALLWVRGPGGWRIARDHTY